MSIGLDTDLSKRTGENHVEEHALVGHTEPQQFRHRSRLQKPRHQYQKELGNAEENNVARRLLTRDVLLKILLLMYLMLLLFLLL